MTEEEVKQLKVGDIVIHSMGGSDLFTIQVSMINQLLVEFIILYDHGASSSGHVYPPGYGWGRIDFGCGDPWVKAIRVLE